MKDLINNYFNDKNINANVINTLENDTYITYEIQLNDIKKLNKFNKSMQSELSFILKTEIMLDITDKILITINKKKINNVTNNDMEISLGYDTKSNIVSVSFLDNPHWLIAGSTGSGKSVFLNNLIKELVHKYNDKIEFCFIDLKKVEFYKYNYLNTNICNVANDIDNALYLLDNVIGIMNERYNKYMQNNCLNITEYNEKSTTIDRYLFVVIDELAELILMNKKAVKDKLQRLLQLGRASGIFLICATQRPSTDILPGLLKVNFTTRICFKVANGYDSKTILNQTGAEKLLGNGDGLILKQGELKAIRFQAYAPTNDSILEANKKEVKTKKCGDIINKIVTVMRNLIPVLKGLWYVIVICLEVFGIVAITMLNIVLFAIKIMKRR